MTTSAPNQRLADIIVLEEWLDNHPNAYDQLKDEVKRLPLVQRFGMVVASKLAYNNDISLDQSFFNVIVHATAFTYQKLDELGIRDYELTGELVQEVNADLLGCFFLHNDIETDRFDRDLYDLIINTTIQDLIKEPTDDQTE
jgi:hypothetical protein